MTTATAPQRKYTPVSYKATDVYADITRTTDDIYRKAKALGYVISGDTEFDQKTFERNFQRFSKSQKKKVIKAIQRAQHASTLDGFNRFLRFTHNKVWQTPDANKHYFKAGKAEQAMIELRKKWVAARDAAQVALKQYKDAKAAYWQDIK